ncbi:inositol monophosphatase family protein [Actinoplanes sp. NPDC049596]|uniref:inositol monophosphatase family protein n=1 Tax=unclassified Actinoplanes TaxID=2626549 RepID=UPI003441160D
MVMLSNKPWDTSAGVIIAREAGAPVTDDEGSPHTMSSHETIAANADLLPAVVRLLER